METEQTQTDNIADEGNTASGVCPYHRNWAHNTCGYEFSSRINDEDGSKVCEHGNSEWCPQCLEELRTEDGYNRARLRERLYWERSNGLLNGRPIYDIDMRKRQHIEDIKRKRLEVHAKHLIEKAESNGTLREYAQYVVNRSFKHGHICTEADKTTVLEMFYSSDAEQRQSVIYWLAGYLEMCEFDTEKAKYFVSKTLVPLFLLIEVLALELEQKQSAELVASPPPDISPTVVLLIVAFILAPRAPQRCPEVA